MKSAIDRVIEDHIATCQVCREKHSSLMHEIARHSAEVSHYGPDENWITVATFKLPKDDNVHPECKP